MALFLTAETVNGTSLSSISLFLDLFSKGKRSKNKKGVMMKLHISSEGRHGGGSEEVRRPD